MNLKSLAVAMGLVVATAATAASPAGTATERARGDTTLAAVTPRSPSGESGKSALAESAATRAAAPDAEAGGGAPEPKLYALLFAGLMAAVFISRRRSD